MTTVDPVSVVTSFGGAVTCYATAYLVYREKQIRIYIPMFLLIWATAFAVDGFHHLYPVPPLIDLFYSLAFFAFVFITTSIAYPLRNHASKPATVTPKRRQLRLDPISFMVVYAVTMSIAAFLPGAITDQRSMATWYVVGVMGFFACFYPAFCWVFWQYWRLRKVILNAPLIAAHKVEIALFLIGFFSFPLVLFFQSGYPLVPEWMVDLLVLGLTWVILTPAMIFGAKQPTFDEFYWTFSGKKQLELLKNAIQQSAEGVMIADLTGRIVFASQGWAKMHGCGLDEVIGKNFSFAYSEEHLRKFGISDGSLLSKGAHSQEIEHTRKNGSILTELSTVAALRDSKGQPFATLSISRDITQRKEMEKKLIETNRKLEMLFETAMEGITLVDIDENITFANKAFAELLGYAEADLVGKNLAEFVDEDEFKKIRRQTFARTRGAVNRYELVIHRKDGEPRFVQVSASPLFDENGAFSGTLGIVMDITERKKAEEALQESQKKFERLFNSNPEASVFVDEKDYIIDVNPRFSELFGYSPDEGGETT